MSKRTRRAQHSGLMAGCTAPRYYLKRLWKISWTVCDLGQGRVRIAKHYERRDAIGKPWAYVRGIAFEGAV